MRFGEDEARLYKQFSKNIGYLQKTSEIKQSSIASALKVSQSMISQYTTGKSRPNLKTMCKLANYFNVSLQSLLFSDFEQEDCEDKETKRTEVGRWTAPIIKLTKTSYYLYYLRETDSGKQPIICEGIVMIGEKKTSHSADATIKLSEKGVERKTEICMDESYAYIDCHDYQHDYFFYLLFFYHRKSSKKSYRGGLGLVQMLDFKGTPVAQYCVISRGRISTETRNAIMEFLRVGELKNEPIYKQPLSSNGVFRLSKRKDKLVYEWLRNNKYI